MNNELRIIISGGGTGGHIFPAVSIANAIKAKRPDAKILFVGAKGRMEMQRVPAAGYEIKGLPICGFDRKHLLKNFAVLFRIWKSQRMAKKIIKDFKRSKIVHKEKEPGRNDPCPCGSGKKYKKCCGANK